MTEFEFISDQLIKSPVRLVAGSMEALKEFVENRRPLMAIDRYSTTGRLIPQYIPFVISARLNHNEVKIEDI